MENQAMKRKPLLAIHKEILLYRDEWGYTFSRIAKQIDLSEGRVNQLYHDAKNRKNYHELGSSNDVFYGLSTRAINCIYWFGIETKDQLLDAIQSYGLYPNKTRNYGWKTHREICDWLKIDFVEKPKTVWIKEVCECCGQVIKATKQFEIKK
jgi:hypothetical protein